MLDAIKVELVNNNFSLLDALALVSTVLGIASALYVFIEKISQSKKEKLNLIITPIDTATNYLEGYYFINFIFSNQSSKPLSLLDFRILSGKKIIPRTLNGEGGTVSFKQIDVINLSSDGPLSSYQNPDITDYGFKSSQIPIVIPAYESKSGFVAFHINESDYLSVFSTPFTLEVTTSKGLWKNEMITVTSSNYSDFSYTNKSVIGRAVKPLTRRQAILIRIRKLLRRSK